MNQFNNKTTNQTSLLERRARRGLAQVMGLGVLASTLCLAAEARAESHEVAIPKAAVAVAFNAALASMEVNLDTYGAKKGVSWYQNKSYALLPSGKRVVLPIPEESVEVTDRRTLKYYLSDFKTQRISAAVDGDKLKFSLAFESQGEEVKGKCVRDPLIGKDKECSLDMERDVHLDNARIEISVKPTVIDGGISYANPEVSFKTDVKIANRLCQAFKGICGRIEDMISRKVRQGVEAGIDKALSDDGVRRAVAAAVKRHTAVASRLTGFSVQSIRSQGDDFVLRVTR